MRSDKELRQSYEITTNKQDGIIFFVVLQVVNEKQEDIRQTELILEDFKKIFTENPEQKWQALIDLRPMPEEGTLTAQGYNNLSKIGLNEQLTQIAFLGGTEVQNTLLKNAVEFIGHFGNKLSWFENEQEAKFWLQEMKSKE